MADLTNHGRPLSKCIAKSTNTINKTSQNKENWPVQHRCNEILLAEIEHKVWFIHQNLGHVDRRTCWADIQKCLQDVNAFLCVPCEVRSSTKKKLSSDLSKTKTQEQSRLNGLAKHFVHQKTETTETLAQHCEKRIAKQTSHPPFEIQITSSAQALPWFNTGNVERWTILQTTPSNSPSQAERKFYGHFLRKALSIDRANPSETTQHRLGKCSETHTNFKKHKEKKHSVQHRAPRRRLGDTSCERWRWLSKPSESMFAKKKTQRIDRRSFICTKNVSQTSIPEAPVSPCGIRILRMATLWIEKWTLEGRSWTDLVTTRHTLGNRVSMDTWIWTATSANSMYASSIEGSRRNKRRFAECDELSSTPEENMNTMCSGNVSQQNCSAKDFPRVANRCLHMDTLNGGNMKHEHRSETHTSHRMCSWCDPWTMEKQSEMKLPTFAEMHKRSTTHIAHKTTATSANNNEKKNQNTTRAWNQSQQTRTRCNPHKQKTHSTVRKHTDEGTQRFKQRKWCQNSTTNRSRRNHLRNCLHKRNPRPDHIDTQTKTRWHKNHFAKRWQSEPSHAQLVFQRDHTCKNDTTKQRTTIRQIPTTSHWKNNGPKWSFLAYDSQNNPHLWPMKSDATEVLKNWLTKIPN